MTQTSTAARPRSITASAIIAVIFGALTLLSGGQALFGDAAANAWVGNAVNFVLWFNFFAGFAYIAAGFGLFFTQRWAVRLALAIAVATLVVFAGFGVHVLLGGAYEARTAGAMALRTACWLIIARVALRRIGF